MTQWNLLERKVKQFLAIKYILGNIVKHKLVHTNL